MQRHIKISRALFFCATVLPPCLIAALVYKYGVDFPFEDQWAFAHFFLKFSQGTLTLGDLFLQHNEYRQFFPNLVIVALGWLTRWDVRYEMAFSFLLALLISFNVYRLGTLTLGPDDARRGRLAFLLSNLLIFSPAQHLNWLMGEQLIYFFPAACVTTCLVVAYSGLGVRAKFALCACLSAVSTFSSANGLVCWVVVYPALAWAGARDVPKGARLRLALAWAFGFALSAALYFYDYRSTPGHPSITSAFRHPFTAVAHFLSLLGSTLTGENASLLFVAVGVGLVLLSLYAANALRVLRAGAAHPSTRRAVGWLMLGAYSILSAAAVSLGRSGMGVGQSLSSRYTTFTLYLIVALIYLLALRGVDADGKADEARKLSLSRLVPACVAVMLCLHALVSYVGVQQMELLRTRLLQGKACHMLVEAVPDPECLKRHLFPKLAQLRPWTHGLGALGFWRPGIVKSNRVEEFAAPAATPSGDYGSFDVLEGGGGVYRASGRALLPHRREPPDAVLLAYEVEGGGHVAFVQADLKNRGYIFIRFWQPRQDAGWEKSFDAGVLPPGASSVTAWAFDAETGRAFRLEGTHGLRGL